MIVIHKTQHWVKEFIAFGVVAGLTALSAASVAAVTRGSRYAGVPWGSRSPVIAEHGMAATEQPLASLAAVDILRKGGSAVDAAIAASAMLSLTEPMLNGPGGDSFVMIWDPNEHKLYGYNGSGPTPRGRTLMEMRKAVESAYHRAGIEPERDAPLQVPEYGSLTVTVPGLVDTWFAIHKKFGKLPISEDLAPAIRAAKNGFPVSEVMARYWKLGIATMEDSPLLRGDLDGLKETYLVDGHAPEQGDVFKNPWLAHTLQAIASGGRNAFYEGAIAHKMADYLAKVGGAHSLTYRDFADFHGQWVTPESVTYRGYDVYELPPNGQGFATLEMLNVLSGFDLKRMGDNSIDMLMAQVGAKRLAFEDLSKYYGDPKFYHAPIRGLLSSKYASTRRKLLDLQNANPDIEPGNPFPYNGDTTNLATADSNGMMVSMIESNFQNFGSGLAAPGLGFAFQDRGALFALDDGAANSYAPGKRPFHTIIPAFVTKGGKPWMAFTVMGGPFQPQGQVQILVNMIDFGMNIQSAADAARWYHTGDASPTGQPKSADAGTVVLEPGFGQTAAEGLRARGYKVQLMEPGYPFGFGGFEGIRVHFDNGTRIYWGGTEFRRDGEVVAY